MAVKIFSLLIQGLEAKLIEVEADILQGMPAFNIVGLGDTAVQESKERIHSAIKNSGANYPPQKKVINLAPAHFKKHGPHFDLPIAVALLAASNQIPIPENAIFIGELALDGNVKPILGALSVAIFAAKQNKKLFLPLTNCLEASLIKDAKIYPVAHLKDLIKYFKNEQPIEIFKNDQPQYLPEKICETDFSEIHGQEEGKRALQISATGGHHLLFYGSPGIGKTLLARALPGILPPLNEKEFLEVMQIYSTAGLLTEDRLYNKTRPLRQVHHSASAVALTGGGTTIHPGEISLAHRGILFLDEIAEFTKTHLESLRQPLEEKKIHLSRQSGAITFPADFTLVATMNPCPCGYFGDKQKSCNCSPTQILHYQKKLSGPILDRLDLKVQIARQSLKTLENIQSESSNTVRQRIIKVRAIQAERFKSEKISLNSEMRPMHLSKYCNLNTFAKEMLEKAAEKLILSMRAYHQILKVSRTIADLNNHNNVEISDLSEALQYRDRSREL